MHVFLYLNVKLLPGAETLMEVDGWSSVGVQRRQKWSHRFGATDAPAGSREDRSVRQVVLRLGVTPNSVTELISVTVSVSLSLSFVESSSYYFILAGLSERDNGNGPRLLRRLRRERLSGKSPPEEEPSHKSANLIIMQIAKFPALIKNGKQFR